MVLPPDVLARARHQDGVISRRQILARGYSEGQVEGWVHRRRLVPVQRGVYRIPGGAWRPEQEAMAAVLRCAPGARVSGPLVLTLLGAYEPADERFTVLTRPGRRVRNVSFPTAPDPFPDRFRARFRELPIVTGPFAVLEAGRFLQGEAFLDAIDASRWSNTARTQDLVELAGGLSRHPGALQVRRFDREGLLDLESGGERRLDRALIGFDPRPERQVWLAPDLRVDFLFRDVLLVIEYAGRRHHRGVRNRSRDAGRDERIRALGYDVVHIYSEDLADPDGLRARVAAARRRARARHFPAGARGTVT